MPLRLRLVGLLTSLCALVGATVLAAPAQAAAAPTPLATSAFTLTADYSSFSTAYTKVAAALPKVTVDTVMKEARQDRQPLCSTATISMVKTVAGGFCFEQADSDDCHNWPQGITTTRDAVGERNGGTYSGHQLVAVSWGYRSVCGGDDTRSRLTLVDWDATWANTYRKILFVEPFVNASGQGDIRDVPIHAGGVVWYGDYLYVADTGVGLRVFDMARIHRTTSSGSDLGIGRQADGTYQAHNYAYVLPQIGTVRFTGTANPKLSWSTISLDRAGAPTTVASLVMAEYTCRPGSTPTSPCTTSNSRVGRAARFPFQPESVGGGRFAPTTTATEAVTLPFFKVNGVASHNKRWWFNSSGDKQLTYWTSGTTTATPYPWTTYGESMSYWEDTSAGAPDLIWTLREQQGSRNVFAFEQASYG